MGIKEAIQYNPYNIKQCENNDFTAKHSIRSGHLIKEAFLTPPKLLISMLLQILFRSAIEAAEGYQWCELFTVVLILYTEGVFARKL